MTVDRVGLGAALDTSPVDAAPTILILSAVKLRRGHQLRLVILGPTTISVDAANRDGKLVELVAETQRARALVLASAEKPIAVIAADHGRCRTRLGKLAGLACLAPDIVTTIVEGRQPRTLTAANLLLCWQAQRTVLGFS